MFSSQVMDSAVSTSGRSHAGALLFAGGVLLGSAVAAGAAWAFLQYLPGPDVDSRRPRRRAKTGIGCVASAPLSFALDAGQRPQAYAQQALKTDASTVAAYPLCQGLLRV